MRSVIQSCEWSWIKANGSGRTLNARYAHCPRSVNYTFHRWIFPPALCFCQQCSTVFLNRSPPSSGETPPSHTPPLGTPADDSQSRATPPLPRPVVQIFRTLDRRHTDSLPIMDRRRLRPEGMRSQVLRCGRSGCMACGCAL